MTARLIDCPRCHGNGEIQFNPSRINDPQCVDNAACPDCHGEGTAELLTPQELGTLLAAIVQGMSKLDGASLTHLESATEKLRQLHGLPTGPAE